MILLDHPQLGMRYSYSTEEVAQLNVSRVRHERSIDVQTPHGTRPAALFSVDGWLYDGECILVPLLTNKGRMITALQAESLAEKMLADTIKAAREGVNYDPDAGVEVHTNAEDYSQPLRSDYRVMMERILADKHKVAA